MNRTCLLKKPFIVAVICCVCCLSCALFGYAEADEDGPSIQPDRDWWIMVGPKNEKENSELQSSMKRLSSLFPNLQPELASTSDFFGLPKGKWAVFVGPSRNKGIAEATLKAIKKSLQDAKLVQIARRLPRAMPWFSGRWLLTWADGNLNGMKLTVNRDSYEVTGTVINDSDPSCGVTGKCSAVNKAMLSVICPVSGLSFDMNLTLDDMDSGTGEFYIKGDKGPLTISRN